MRARGDRRVDQLAKQRLASEEGGAALLRREPRQHHLLDEIGALLLPFAVIDDAVRIDLHEGQLAPCQCLEMLVDEAGDPRPRGRDLPEPARHGEQAPEGEDSKRDEEQGERMRHRHSVGGRCRNVLA